MLKSYRSASALLGALLIASLAQPAAAATPAPDEWLPSVVDSSMLTSSVVSSGNVTSPDGHAFPEGATVELLAYPAEEVMRTLKEGDTIQVSPVAKARTDESGHFEMRLAEPSKLKRYASALGVVNFEIRAISGAYYAAFSFSSELDALNGARMQRADLVGLNLVSLPANDAVLNLEGSRMGPINKTQICGETLVANYGTRAVAIGQTYTAGAGRTGSLTYTSGSSSTLGVGLSMTGVYGSYSASGSISLSSTTTVSFAGGTGGRLYKTYYVYGKYAQWCYPIGGSYDPSDIYAYKVRASSFAGGSAVSVTSAPPANYCVALANGSTLTKSSTTAGTFSSGAKLIADIGIDLSVRTGYTSSTKVAFTNSSGSSKNLCGVSGYPGGTPGFISLL